MTHFLIVGASRGLGLGFSIGLPDPGDTVFLVSRTRPPIDESWIAASFSPPDQITPELATALNISDELIDELLAAELYVFGIPMYNYSMPANFKAYIDQIVRVRRTFVVSQNGYEGLLKDKKILVITTRGGSYSAGVLDFLQTVFTGSFWTHRHHRYDFYPC